MLVKSLERVASAKTPNIIYQIELDTLDIKECFSSGLLYEIEERLADAFIKEKQEEIFKAINMGEIVEKLTSVIKEKIGDI